MFVNNSQQLSQSLYSIEHSFPLHLKKLRLIFVLRINISINIYPLLIILKSNESDQSRKRLSKGANASRVFPGVGRSILVDRIDRSGTGQSPLSSSSPLLFGSSSLSLPYSKMAAGLLRARASEQRLALQKRTSVIT